MTSISPKLSSERGHILNAAAAASLTAKVGLSGSDSKLTTDPGGDAHSSCVRVGRLERANRDADRRPGYQPSALFNLPGTPGVSVAHRAAGKLPARWNGNERGPHSRRSSHPANSCRPSCEGGPGRQPERRQRLRVAHPRGRFRQHHGPTEPVPGCGPWPEASSTHRDLPCGVVVSSAGFTNPHLLGGDVHGFQNEQPK